MDESMKALLKQQDWKLWYKQPADNWDEALPIGNGRLGGMVFGGIHKERIQLNEDTLWSGFPRDTVNYEAIRHLKKARSCCLTANMHRHSSLSNVIWLAGDANPILQWATCFWSTLALMNHQITGGSLTSMQGLLLRDIRLVRTITFVKLLSVPLIK